MDRNNQEGFGQKGPDFETGGGQGIADRVFEDGAIQGRRAVE